VTNCHVRGSGKSKFICVSFLVLLRVAGCWLQYVIYACGRIDFCEDPCLCLYTTLCVFVCVCLCVCERVCVFVLLCVHACVHACVCLSKCIHYTSM